MKSLESILSGVAAVLNQAKATKASNFEQLVIAVADGDNVIAENAASILEACGKSDTDLKAAVEVLLARRANAELLKGEKAELDKYHGAEEEARQLTAELEKISQEYAEKIRERLRFVHGITIATSKYDNARRHLAATCSATLKEREKELAKQQTDVHVKRAGVAHKLFGPGGNEKHPSPVIGTPGHNLVQFRNDVKAAEQSKSPRLAECKKKLADFERDYYNPLLAEYHQLGKEIDAFTAELEKLEAEKLIP